MVAAIRLRELSAEEQAWIDKLAHSRTAPTRQVERARIIYHASQGLSAPKIAQLLGAEVETVRRWIHRFNRLRKNPHGGCADPIWARKRMNLTLEKSRAYGTASSRSRLP